MIYRLLDEFPFVCIPSQAASLDLCTRGYVESTEMRLVAEWVRAGDLCFDVGANLGIYTALLGHRVGKSGRIVSLEPSPRSFSALICCIETLGLHQVTALAAAASDRQGLSSFFVSLPGQAGAEEESMQVPESWRTKFEQTVVMTTTLDAILETLEGGVAPSFLKVDVEGAEPLVLRGAQSLLRKPNPPLVLVEISLSGLASYGFSPDDVLHWFPDADFDCFMMPLSMSDSRPGRLFRGIYSVRPDTEWPHLSNLIAVPHAGIFASRRGGIAKFLPANLSESTISEDVVTHEAEPQLCSSERFPLDG